MKPSFARSLSPRRFLGVFVHPVDIQSAGMDAVFDRLEAVGADAICITPKVAVETSFENGVRFPPLHGDGYSRVLDRPIWGKRELYLKFFTCLSPKESLYTPSRYKPTQQPLPPELDFALPARIIQEAHRRGLQAHMLIQPFIPPKVFPEDRPVYVDGSHPRPPQVADYACLNSPDARAFALAQALDTVQNYPEIDGLFTDWAEYGAYRFEDLFACFCPHCQAKAEDMGFDWEMIHADTLALWHWLHALDDVKISRARRLFHSPLALFEMVTHRPGWSQLNQLKAQTVSAFYRELRGLLNQSGFKKIGLSARGWPPPWNLFSGMDYRSLAGVCSAITPKLFTFDYAALPRWYGETLISWNPGIAESQVLDALVEWLHLEDNRKDRSLDAYRIPAPDQQHPVGLEAYHDRLVEIRHQIGMYPAFYPFVHAYLPGSQWEEMLVMVRESPVNGLWIQMLGYLSDEKLLSLKNIWH